jgi:hypothetical protein
MKDMSNRADLLRVAAGRDRKVAMMPLVLGASGAFMMVMSWLGAYGATQKLWEVGVVPYVVAALGTSVMNLMLGLFMVMVAMMVYLSRRLRALVTLLEQEKHRSAEEGTGPRAP